MQLPMLQTEAAMKISLCRHARGYLLFSDAVDSEKVHRAFSLVLPCLETSARELQRLGLIETLELVLLRGFVDLAPAEGDEMLARLESVRASDAASAAPPVAMQI